MSRGDRFDRADFSARYRETAPEAVAPAKAQLAAKLAPSRKSPVRLLTAAWPMDRSKIERVGESVLTDRNGKGRPHKGIDIFADAGTEVLAANAGRVLRVIDGRAGTSATQKHAGLFVDVMGHDALVYRYLHLGEVQVAAGEEMKKALPSESWLRRIPAACARRPTCTLKYARGTLHAALRTTVRRLIDCDSYPRCVHRRM